MQLNEKELFPPNIMIGTMEGYCNLKCPQCPVNAPEKSGEFERGKMSYDDFVKILDEVKEYKPRIIPHTEYEPLILPDFQKYYRAIKERGMSISINTNGLQIDDKVAQDLVDLEVDSITISIDAFTPEALMKVRGIDTLDKLNECVHRLIKYRGDKSVPRIGVSFTRQPANILEEKEFIDYWIEHVDFIRSGTYFTDRILSEKHTLERVPCKYLTDQLVINYKGEARICQPDYKTENPVGNVLSSSVKEIWNSETFKKIREEHQKGNYACNSFCNSCDFWTFFINEEYELGNCIIRKSPFATIYNHKDRMYTWNQKALYRS